MTTFSTTYLTVTNSGERLDLLHHRDRILFVHAPAFDPMRELETELISPGGKMTAKINVTSRLPHGRNVMQFRQLQKSGNQKSPPVGKARSTIKTVCNSLICVRELE